MQIFSSWPERQAQITRGLLLSGWIVLIVSLLAGIDLYPFDVNRCGGSPDCHSLEGNQIFWGMVVPGGLFLLVVFSHELWRRICPLALVSQLFRILGRQRTVSGRGGRREVAKVDPGSWLGRHHVELQWSLLIAGLCLRLLVVNSSTLGLGVLLLLTGAAALVVGWAYGGKAWCQYLCPMAPVQTILTGPRSFFGSPAHIEATSRVTQSMCRTVTESGKVQGACVACQAPCIDIDSERAYWASLRGKRGLNWAWGSYPGLVLAFFLLIKLESRGGLDYLRSGMWAYDNEAAEYAWNPLVTGPWFPAVPRLVAIPVLLVLAGWISVALQGWLRQLQQRQLTPDFGSRAEEMAINRSRLLASFVAVNIFFWFADPTIGLLGPAGGQVIRSLVLIVSGMWLHRGWYRERATYVRESTSASLRRQLEQLIPDLSPYLDGRSLAELSAGEVFTLAKVLPAQISETKRTIYKEVMADLFGSGRLDRATALVQLEELRQSLKLDDEDHWAAIRELAIGDPRILKLTGQQREIRSLRQEAAREAMLELLRVTRTDDLLQLLADPHFGENFDKIRSDFLLDEASWQELLGSFGACSDGVRRGWTGGLERLQEQLAARRSLASAADGDPLLKPLLVTMDRSLTSQVIQLWDCLADLAPEDPRRRTLAGLQRQFPASVQAQIARRNLSEAPIAAVAKAADLAPLPDPADVLDALWHDPDPHTALWTLWVQRRRSPERGEALARQARIGLPTNPALERFIREKQLDGAALLPRLLELPLVSGLAPAGVLSLLRWGKERRWRPGEVIFRIGHLADLVAIVLEGTCEVWRPAGHHATMGRVMEMAAGTPIGAVDHFSDQVRRFEVRAGTDPVHALVVSCAHFGQMLAGSSEFNRGLLQQLARRIDHLHELWRPLCSGDQAA